MIVHTQRLEEKTQGYCDIINITHKVQDQVKREKIRRGLVSLFVSGSTASLTTIEYEPGLIRDLQELLERIIPSNKTPRLASGAFAPDSHPGRTASPRNLAADRPLGL
jgi:thiamine phosphate synthase YjbQ (UPF0047 family)